MNSNYKSFFKSLNIVPRDSQCEGIEWINNNFENKKYMILDAPTGVGKSHIALAIADNNKTYIITATKYLQDQYSRLYPDAVLIKGKANYNCYFNSNLNCEVGLCSSIVSLKDECKKNNLCPYYNQLSLAYKSQVVITNYAYFVLSCVCGSFSKGLYKANVDAWHKNCVRDVAIFDEAHALESALLNISEIKLDILDIIEKYNIKFNSDFDYSLTNKTETEIFETISVIKEKIISKCNYYQSKIDNVYDKYKDKLKTLFETLNIEHTNNFRLSYDDTKKINELHSKLYPLDKIKKRFDVFFDSNYKNWIYKVEDRYKISLSPYKVGNLFHQYLGDIADKFIFMSATIGNKDAFINEYSFNKMLTNSIYLKSKFNPKNSPIVYTPCGKLNHFDIDKTLPKVVKSINEILSYHKNEKGIIHTANYKIAEYIFKNIKSDRFIYKDNQYTNDELIQQHINGSKNSVLLSPSLTEGVSLDDNLSRFQIIVKLPFMSLADYRTETKMKLDNKWYLSKMWTSFIQSSGRSTRSIDDYSLTYVLDSSFKYFFEKSEYDLNDEFVERIIF